MHVPGLTATVASPQFARRRQHQQHQGDREPGSAGQLLPETFKIQSRAVGASASGHPERPAGAAPSESAQIDAENRARLAAMAPGEVMPVDSWLPLACLCRSCNRGSFGVILRKGSIAGPGVL